MVDFGPASRGIGMGLGIIGMGIGLRFMSDTVEHMKSTQGYKSKPYTPTFTHKSYVPKQYSFKPIKWKL